MYVRYHDNSEKAVQVIDNSVFVCNGCNEWIWLSHRESHKKYATRRHAATSRYNMLGGVHACENKGMLQASGGRRADPSPPVSVRMSHVYAYAYACACVCVYVYVCVRVCVRVCVCVHFYAYVFVYACVYG